MYRIVSLTRVDVHMTLRRRAEPNRIRYSIKEKEIGSKYGRLI